MRTRWLMVGLGLGAALACTEHEPELGRIGGDPLPSTGGAAGSGAIDAGTGGTGNAAGSGGSAGQAGAAGAAGCAPVDPSIVNPAFPCDVAEIIENICQRCHSDPPQNSAPFPLVTWQHTQGEYFLSPIWKRMENAIATNFMPFTGIPLVPPVEPLTPEQKQTMLDWLGQCAPPIEATTCP